MAKHIIKPADEDEIIDVVEMEELTNESGFKIAKTALFYAAASLIIALFVVPWNNINSQRLVAAVTGSDATVTSGIDRTVTGSVKKDGTKRKRIRRSVLQSDPSKPCYVLENGTTEGDC